MKLHRQSGASLVVTLVMLIIMSLGAIGLVRSIDASLMLASNLAFRESALLESDAGTQAAVDWLLLWANTANINSDQALSGYYASAPDGLDISGMNEESSSAVIDWDDTNCKQSSAVICQKPAPLLTTGNSGNSVRFIIHRLCRTAGNPTSSVNSCLFYRVGQSGGSAKGSISYGAAYRFTSTVSVYYRITIRVRGPRNTTVFTQTLVHF